MKISTKILLFVSAIAVVAVTAAAGLSMIENAAYVDQASSERAAAGLTDLERGIEEQMESAEHATLLLAGNASVIDGIETGDFDALKTALDTLNSKLFLDTISVTDDQGNVIIRQHQPDNKGDNIADQSNVAQALSGNTQTTIEAGELVKLSCRSGAPVMDGSGKVIGTVVACYAFENQKLVDELKSVHNMEFSIFQGSVRLATTIMKDGQRVTGTELDAHVADTVLKGGKEYSGMADIMGTPYYTAYSPLKDTEGNTVGVLFAGLTAQDANAAKETTLLHVLVFIPVLLAILLLLLVIFVRKTIGKPMKAITAAAQQLADGDTGTAIQVKGRDEIAQMAKAFTAVSGSVDSLARDIHTVSKTVEAGRLGAQTDEEAYRGAYRSIAAGFNEATGKFRQYLDSLPAPVLTMDSDYTVLYMNRAGASLAGMEPEQAAGMKCYDIFKTGDCHTDRCACGRAMANKRPETGETYAHLSADVELNIEYTGTPILLNGEVAGAFEVIVDQTAIKKAGDEANKHADTLTALLAEIDIAAEQVASGTRQVSDGSQQISMGATEQAGAIEELTTTISEIAAQTRQNAASANQASELTLRVKLEAEQGNERMDALQNAMAEINESSAGISKIIKVIDDIAFQTNILALNAAVEAARAGVHGKGFAVVAEEVRNLAARSAAAARETTALIERSVAKAEAGTKIADSTATALKEMVKGVEQAAGLVAEIASSSGEQANAIVQVDRGMEQMAQVVQINSATSEETAAASEELSGQAEYLKNMVGQYTQGGEVSALNARRILPEAPAQTDMPLTEADFGKY